MFMAVIRAVVFIIFLLAVPAVGLLTALYLVIDMVRNEQVWEENGEDRHGGT